MIKVSVLLKKDDTISIVNFNRIDTIDVSVIPIPLLYIYWCYIWYANWIIVSRASVTPLFPSRITSQLVTLHARWIQMYESQLLSMVQSSSVAHGYCIRIRKSLRVTPRSVIEISDRARWQTTRWHCWLARRWSTHESSRCDAANFYGIRTRVFMLHSTRVVRWLFVTQRSCTRYSAASWTRKRSNLILHSFF